MAETMEQEIRSMDVAELRVEGEGKERKINGYAAVFNKDSLPMGWGGSFIERIAPGAFKDVLGSDGLDVRALVNHDPNQVIGRSTVGTLVMNENKKGLKVVITPPDTQLARDLVVSIERGDVDQMSFAFRVGEEVWEFSDNEAKPDKRTITQVAELRDVSVVTYPAYPDATVAVRSHEAAKQREADDAKPEPTPIKDAARVELARRRAEK